jgi:hypothetical protein
MRLPSSKLEFPPLLAVGFHDFSLEKLRELCVDKFAASTTRGIIADEFTKLIDELASAKVPCELWLDGSYFTEKLIQRTLISLCGFAVKSWTLLRLNNWQSQSAE